MNKKPESQSVIKTIETLMQEARIQSTRQLVGPDESGRKHKKK
jgi:hypothetical protein